MYHIPNDQRAVRSAHRLCQGLLDCLERKELKSITVSDLHQASGVSRATFYRLFDTVEDVVVYQCDLLYDALAEELQSEPAITMEEFFIDLTRRWLTMPKLMEAMVRNDMIGVLIRSYDRHAELLSCLTDGMPPLTEVERTYLLCTIIGMLPIMLQSWYMTGQKDSPEEVYRRLKTSLRLVQGLQ